MRLDIVDAKATDKYIVPASCEQGILPCIQHFFKGQFDSSYFISKDQVIICRTQIVSCTVTSVRKPVEQC